MSSLYAGEQESEGAELCLSDQYEASEAGGSQLSRAKSSKHVRTLMVYIPAFFPPIIVKQTVSQTVLLEISFVHLKKRAHKEM